MFRGRHSHVLDEKGRTSLPKDFRKNLESISSEPPWITLFPESLVIFPAPVFKQLEDGLTAIGTIAPEGKGARRLILGSAEACPIDKQGRIMIPTLLREWPRAGLKRDIVFVGVGKYIELWDRELHAASLLEACEDYPNWASVVDEQLKQVGA